MVEYRRCLEQGLAMYHLPPPEAYNILVPGYFPKGFVDIQ